jgi:hypothetical protein
MKTNVHCLLLTVMIGIFCVPSLSGAELPAPIEQRVIGEPPTERGLIGRAHQVLEGIRELYVVIEAPGSEPNKDGLVWKELEKLVRDKLEKEADIAVAEDDVDKMESGSAKKLAELLKKRGDNFRNLEWRSADVPEYRVDIDMLKLDASRQYVFHIQSSLARPVVVPMRRNLHLKTDVWKVRPVMESVSLQDMPDKVTEAALSQVEAFIHACLAANVKRASRSDANDAGTAVQKQPAKHPRKLPAVGYKYVASKNSKVFHRADCRWAQRIKPENLTGYNTRAEAIQAGKRPCKQCKP